MDEFSWASAVGRVRILEKGLLPRASFLALAEAADLRTALGMLRDSPYGPYLSHMENADDYEKALEGFLKDEFIYIYNMAPEPEVVEAFRGRHDFHNLKVLAKAKLLSMEPEEEAMSTLGMLNGEELAEIMSRGLEVQRPGGDQYNAGLRREDTGEVSGQIPMEKAFILEALRRIPIGQRLSQEAEKARRESDETTLWLLIDSFADCAYYEMAGRIYRKAGYEGLLDFYQNEVDMINLKMFLRAKRQDIPEDIYREIVLPGGRVSQDSLTRAYGAGLNQLAQVYKDTAWEKLAGLGSSLMTEGKSLTNWEKECDNTHIALARRFKTYPLGPEPALGYMFGKEVEVRNLRIILTGKEAMISAKEISERLRDSYA